MEPSTELNNLYLRLLDAYNTADVDLLSSLISKENLLFIGSDPSEWWNGHDTFISEMQVQMKAFHEYGFKCSPTDPQAFVEGQIGWLSDRTKWEMPDGSVMETRITAVARLEEGAWKFVQQHCSVAVRNEEIGAQEEGQEDTAGT